MPYRERKKGPSWVHQPKEKEEIRIFSSLLVSVSLLFFYKKRVKSIRKKKKKGGGTFKEGRRQNGRDKETVHKQEQHSPEKVERRRWPPARINTASSYIALYSTNI